ncbi:peptide ABC transporter substrate-binding protein [Bacillus smithii]|uniref:peptide ABC transporter substrate-binding protein n=1 Tax=Bacillus smithii TaxID=1479 RepID=UPI00065E5E98|nr:peptide ABC transporter substrate-binding protein [Bacillus smithii]AKP46388.1 Oligopeptide ABC transporterperiplasmic oligopeptide-binding protein OppA TC 3.A.1.5.1 [Bacillus smithii]MED4884781.1 peptide ABC transporter substrate-binding protein [Bacillus smithii]MED4926792.1 peptide ABC transporter substrate-binding protein [Bacillus smithii]
MKKKFSLFLVLLLALGTVLTACSGSKSGDGGKNGDNAKKDQVLNLVETQEIPTMDSALATDVVSFTALNNVMEGLYRLGKNDEPVEGIAEGEPQVSKDGKTWTFKLRDAKWSNGDPVTAGDFVYAWRKVVDPKTASQYAYIMYDIKNAQAINEGKMKPEQLGVKALDDKTLQVQLESPVPYFKNLLTFGTFLPQDEKYVKEQGKKYGLEADTTVYNGPFVLSSWKHDDKWQMKKNPNYWDKDSVKLKEVNVKVIKDTQTGVNLYESNATDRVNLDSEFVDKYKNDKDLKYEKEATVFFLRFNEQNPVLKNVDARKAISMAFDKNQFTKVVLNNGSIPADYFVPAEFVKGPNGKYFRDENGNFNTYNVKEAKKYWAKAKKALGKDKITLELLNYDDDLSRKAGEYLKEQLEKNLKGLTVNIKQQPFKQKLDLEAKMNYDFSLAGWGPDYADPMTFIDMFVTDGGNNEMHYSNPEYDKLVQEAKTTYALQPEKRWEAMLKAEKILLDQDAAIAPVYQRGRAVLQRPYVKGLLKHKVGPELSYKWVSIQ